MRYLLRYLIMNVGCLNRVKLGRLVYLVVDVNIELFHGTTKESIKIMAINDKNNLHL
uniref:Uncharacterized protein n=1 Tax=Octopus bimaculoides TaxID=37653 RepID=A0A0L8HEH5_OCTBM